jgi:hypothetical protein
MSKQIIKYFLFSFTSLQKADNTALVIHYRHGSVGRTKVEVVVKDEQVKELLSKLRERLHGEEGVKIFVVAISLIDILRLWKTNLSRPAIMYRIDTQPNAKSIGIY